MEKLKNIMSTHTSLILYSPLADEPKFIDSKLFQINLHKRIILPKNKDSDPFEWARRCVDLFREEKVIILVPGRLFDVYGTRHGRGFGWYDKFFSSLPLDWLRIGVTYSQRLSQEKITRHTWDEQVDWILSQDEFTFSWKAYETLARLK